MRIVSHILFKDYLSKLKTTLSIKHIDGVKYYFYKSSIKAKIVKGKYYIA